MISVDGMQAESVSLRRGGLDGWFGCFCFSFFGVRVGRGGKVLHLDALLLTELREGLLDA